ncbi:SprT family protein [Streptococcus caviae]|uniref:SprT family protein n=1 Tax=Streptococcus sp. 'caviae' TaxID=1915004 RepID=UPI00094BA52C|nr:SprT family protein [Streptococcus sp. 'caviae']OLN83612.1 SprT family protein [Streptococcus sp. 'caviae']
MNLTEYVKDVSRQDFGMEFKHKALWNSRLQTTGGRFFPQDGHLDFNPKFYKRDDLETFRKIVRHELCHYHLYYAGKGYRHRDKDFKELLLKVNGSRYAPSLRSKTFYYSYQCQNCGQVYQRKRRINTEKFACGSCRGRLSPQNQSQG